MIISPVTRGPSWQTASASRREKNPREVRPPDNPSWEKFPEMEDRKNKLNYKKLPGKPLLLNYPESDPKQ